MSDLITEEKPSRLREFIRREGLVAVMYALALHLLIVTFSLNTPRAFVQQVKDVKPTPVLLGSAESIEDTDEEKEEEADQAASAPSIDAIPEIGVDTPLAAPEVVANKPVEKPIEEVKEQGPSAAEKLLDSIDAPSAGPRASGVGGKGNAAYEGRSDIGRVKALARFGGSAASEEAVERGLAWLARVQELDNPESRDYGAWSPSEFGKHYLERSPLENDREWKHRLREEGIGDDDNTLGLSALVALAFTGRGITADHERFGSNIRAAIGYLLRMQDDNGFFHNSYGRTKSGNFYDHCLSLQAVADYAALSKQESLLPAVQRGVDALVSGQKAKGGWDYYTYPSGDLMRNRGDSSITGFALMALISSKAAGAKVPEDAIIKVIAFLKQMARPDGLVIYSSGEKSTESANETLSGVNLLSRRLLGEPASAPIQAKLTQQALLDRPSWGDISMKDHSLYRWYYSSLALVVAGEATDPDWLTYNASMQRALLAKQERSEGRRGSWPADDYYAEYGGRIWTTAMSVLCLEVYYRYIPEHLQRSAQEYRRFW
ncbi:MAG: hypothetical protein KDB07_03060 [Planctomycetes bacterium]|nr:hypothetical protein [Planctomycetota bacterium]